MKKKALVVGVVVLAVLAAAAALVLAGGGQQVEVVKATRGVLTLTVEETGYVRAVDESRVQASQAARVIEVLVEPGDTVEPGETLMRLASPELLAAVEETRSQLLRCEAELQDAELNAEQLRAELEQAEEDLARKKSLLDSGALTRVEYEQAELEVTRLRNSLLRQEAAREGLNNELAGLRKMLASQEERVRELQVVSPIGGTVLDLPVKTGQVVSPGTLLAQVGSENRLEVEVELLSDDLRMVKEGQTARITAPVLGERTLTGKVSKIHPRAYERTSALGVVQRRVPVTIALDESGNLKPGYEVRVSIETLRKEGVLLLPRESVRLAADGSYRVLALVNGRLEERVIQVGEKNQQVVEVIKGIKPGESVVRDGSQELKEGTRVKPVPAGS
ncbi:efflux transporter, RND family, MFP subunit [Thermacetogenium phaeum DSM 12270]|uniref:Efflux transporter, RND family, MFP subunit n=1 Tax=Thermacetogenium phaeum (strain ATCC BAA-254 / DSM 26808 / PB) TaxID=1089553 RepID=K4LKQ1_THEPS|nr:efflux RND transporter periplasmic adaptor subunit [Thermacetogenium phaeum]AFV12555.1 efflux transporter, RND family, MFP subunit [Thermacetogenium phaeum DSM 12270]